MGIEGESMILMRTSASSLYKELCGQLISAPKVAGTRELNNVILVLTDIEKNVVGNRDISLSYLLGELTWYSAGRNDVEFISKFASLWERISDDGVTNNSAYGYILQHKHGFNQIEKMIELLKTDPTSRRAVININIPNPNVIETKDEMCTIALQFLLRNGRLHCTGIMRSNDIWYGFPYDLVYFTEIQKYIARRLEVAYGTYTHFVGSMHVYDRDIESARKVAFGKYETHDIRVNYELLLSHIDELIEEVESSPSPRTGICLKATELGILTDTICG